MVQKCKISTLERFWPLWVHFEEKWYHAIWKRISSAFICKKPHQKILRRSKVIKKAVKSIFLQNDPHAGCVHAVHAGHAEYLFQPGDSQNVYVTCAENRISKYWAVHEEFNVKNGRLSGYWDSYCLDGPWDTTRHTHTHTNVSMGHVGKINKFFFNFFLLIFFYEFFF